MINRLLLLTFVLPCISIGCTTKDTSESDQISLPQEIEEIESLVIIDNEPEYRLSIADSQNYGEIFIPMAPPAPVRALGAKNVVDGGGNVFRYDRNDVVIKKYNPEGQFLGNIARKGRGPGEFVRVASMQIFDNQLMVYDADLMRISFFDTESRELVRSFQLEYNSWEIEDARYLFPRTLTKVENESYLVSTLTEKDEGLKYSAYYIINENSQIISDRVVETQNKAGHTGRTKMGYNAEISLPFSARGEITDLVSGNFYHMNTGEFLIRKYNLEGEVEKVFYMPFKKDPLEEQEVLDQYYPTMHSVFDEVDYPETWPALDQIFVDDKNRIWVSTIVDDHFIYKWHIISDSGKLLATLDWPREKEFITIRNGRIYTEFFDREAGMRVMTRYTFEFTE
jgi:hypothetical protein